MLAADEDALLCDMAETYGIYDTWEETTLPIWKYAAFAAFLKPDSRIKMILSKQKADTEEILLTAIFDVLNWIRWSKTVDGEKNINRPEPLLNRILETETGETNGERTTADGGVVFESPEAFEQEFERLRLLCQ